jgi:hypothetical protein
VTSDILWYQEMSADTFDIKRLHQNADLSLPSNLNPCALAQHLPTQIERRTDPTSEFGTYQVSLRVEKGDPFRPVTAQMELRGLGDKS